MSRFLIPALNAVHHSSGLCDSGNGHVIEHTSTMIDGGLSKSDREAGIVELAIEIFDTTKEMLGFDVRNSRKGLLAREDFRPSKIQPAGQGVVDFQPDSKKWPFPPFVTRNNKGEVMDKVRGVSMEQAALAQGFQDQGNIALFEITNAAVNEFRTAA
jgi:hypothetical protein